MSDLNKKLDAYVRKEKLKVFAITLLILAIVVPLVSWLALPPLGPVSEVKGEVKTLVGLPSDEGEKLFIVVDLEDGKEVRSRITNVSFYKKGKNVMLMKHEPLVFGKTVYRFKGYAE